MADQKREKLNKLKEAYIKLMENNLTLINQKNNLDDSNIDLREKIKEIKKKGKEMLASLGQEKTFNLTEIKLNQPQSTRLIQQILPSKHELYSVYVPPKVKNATMACKGCGKLFMVINRRKDPAYYVHCGQECPDYMDLGLIRKCHECKLIFTNKKQLFSHRQRIHLEKKGQTKSIIKCKGCNLKFTYRSQGSNDYSKYLNHCLEECLEYQKLGLIVKCVVCSRSFLDNRSLSIHLTRIHGFKSRPKWISPNIQFPKSFNTRVSCKGCGKKFPAKIRGKDQSRLLYSLEYYIHCIKKCSKFKQLGSIATCKFCGCKFLNLQSCRTHEGRAHAKKGAK